MRTLEQILIDFKKLGYEYITDNCTDTGAVFNAEGGYLILEVNFKRRTYQKYLDPWGSVMSMEITMEEHKLLHELFELAGWLSITKLEEQLKEFEYKSYNDAYNFGKVKRNSINTNVSLQDKKYTTII